MRKLFSAFISGKSIIDEVKLNDEINTLISDAFSVRSNSDGELLLRHRTKLFNPVITLKVDKDVSVGIDDDKATILIDTETRFNGWFWFTSVTSLLFPPVYLLLIWMYTSQRDKSYKMMKNIMTKIENMYSIL